MVSQSKLKITRKLFYWLTISNFLYIIVLLILAGVTVATLTGENGLLKKSSAAGEETKIKTAEEKMNLKITSVQMKNYAENKTMPTLQVLADELCEDDDMEYVHLKEAEQASLDKVIVGETDSILTKLKEYPYEFEINSSLQLASIDGIKVATVPANDDDTIISMTKAELKSFIKSETSSDWTLLKSESGHYDDSTAISLPNNFSELLVEVGKSDGFHYTFSILKDMLTNNYKSYASGFGFASNCICTSVDVKNDKIFIDDYFSWSSTNQSSSAVLTVYYK